MRTILLAALLCLASAATANLTKPDDRDALAKALQEAQDRTSRAEARAQISEMRDSLSTHADSRFQSWVEIYGILFTFMVIGLGYISHRLAIAEVSKGLAEQRGQLDELVTEARSAASQATGAAAAAQQDLAETGKRIEELLRKAEAATVSTEQHAERANAALSKIERGAAIVDKAARQYESSSVDQQTPRLTTEEADAVRAGAEASKDKDSVEKTIDDFKVEIGNALYNDQDPEAALRLAIEMATKYENDPDATCFALLMQGEAMTWLQRTDDALVILDSLVSRFKNETDSGIQFHVANAHVNKGNIFLGDYSFAQAEAEFRIAVGILTHSVGEDNESALVARQLAARAASDQGRGTESVAELVKILRIQEEKQGLDHPETIRTRHELARAQVYSGELEAAEQLLKCTIAAAEKTFGAEHRNVLISRLVRARALSDNGKYDDAEKELLELIKIKRRIFGPRDPTTLKAQLDLAGIKVERGQAARALRQQKALLDTMRRSESARPKDVLEVRGEMARATLELGRLKEAAKLFQELASEFEQLDGVNNLRTVALRAGVLESQMPDHDPVEIEAEARGLVELAESNHGDSYGFSIFCNLILCEAMLRQGKSDEAHQIWNRLNSKQIIGFWPPRRRAHAAFLGAQVKNAVGDFDAARALLVEAESALSNFPQNYWRRRALRAYRKSLDS